MTEKAKRKGIEIAAGTLAGLIVWAIEAHVQLGRKEAALLFLVPYVILSASTYAEQIKKLKSLKFFDENLLMIAATCGAFAVWHYKEAVGAMLLYQAGRLVEEMSLSKTKKAIAEFIDIRPEYANLKDGLRERVVEPWELRPGQTIVLRPGEKIPVDAVVKMGTGTVDMKALTGESKPRAVRIGDKLYSGGINLNGVLEARVVKAYSESMASKVMKLVENANEKKSDSMRLADKFTKYYTPAVILIAALTFILPPLMFPGTRDEWIFRSLILLVAACPSGLLVSIPMAFLGGIGAASRQGVLIKGSRCIETLTKADTFVFDKTGTLTEGVFHVQEVVPWQISEEELLELAALAETYSTHPIAMSLQKAYGKEGDKSRVGEVTEFPGMGLCAEVDGRKVYVGNHRLINSRGLFCRPAAGPGTAVHVAIEDEYAGYILIADVIRKDAARLIRWLSRQEMAAVMFTGDNEEAAEDVAAKLRIENVYADLMPEDKVEQLEEFRESQMEGEKLVFVGDGINDAPVLTRADVGIAMGGLGADAALEAADIILMEDEPSKIINAVRISRATLRSVKQNMGFAIGMKVVLIVLAFLGLITMQNAIIADVVVMLINILNSFWMMKYPE